MTQKATAHDTRSAALLSDQPRSAGVRPSPSPRRRAIAAQVAAAALLLGCASTTPDKLTPARDVAKFSSSFEADEPMPANLAGGGLRIEPGAGPERPYTAKPKAGYTGLRALRYQAEGSGGRMQLFPVDIAIDADTTLSWKVLPEIVDDDTVASTGVSLDLVLDDGSRLSGLGMVDHHGVRVGAAAQAESQTLYPQQWANK